MNKKHLLLFMLLTIMTIIIYCFRLKIKTVEFIEYNTIRALDYIGDMAPIVLMYKYENGEDF